MSRSDAAARSEIAPDPVGWLTALRFDIDTDGAGAAWIEAELPPPNLIIVNPANGHAHLIYLLEQWIDVRFLARNVKAIRYADAIEQRMAAALGADRAYVGKFQHNPLATKYVTRVGRDAAYKLGELAQFLDMHMPVARVETSSGLGRNVDLFDRLRHWAYRARHDFRDRSQAEWDAAVADRAGELNYDVAAAYPRKGALCANEVRRIVASVAKWVWMSYAGCGPEESVEKLAARREKARNRAANARRAAGSADRGSMLAEQAQRIAEALHLREMGLVAAAIAERIGVSLRTVRRWFASKVTSPYALSEFDGSGPEVRAEAQSVAIKPQAVNTAKPLVVDVPLIADPRIRLIDALPIDAMRAEVRKRSEQIAILSRCLRPAFHPSLPRLVVSKVEGSRGRRCWASAA